MNVYLIPAALMEKEKEKEKETKETKQEWPMHAPWSILVGSSGFVLQTPCNTKYVCVAGVLATCFIKHVCGWYSGRTLFVNNMCG